MCVWEEKPLSTKSLRSCRGPCTTGQVSRGLGYGVASRAARTHTSLRAVRRSPHCRARNGCTYARIQAANHPDLATQMMQVVCRYCAET